MKKCEDDLILNSRMDPQAQYEPVFIQRFLCTLCGALLTDSKSCERHTSLVHGIKKCWLPSTTLVSNVCPNATYAKNGCRDLRLITGSEVTVETSNRVNKPSSLPNITPREALQVSQISITEVSVAEKNRRSSSSSSNNKTSSSNNDNSSDEDITDTGFHNVPPLFKSIPDHGFYTLQRRKKITRSKYCKKIGGKSIATVQHCDRSPNVEPFQLNCVKCDCLFHNIADFKTHVKKLCHFTGWYCYPCKERFTEFHQFWKHGCCHKAANSYVYKTMQFYYRNNKEIWECYVCRQLFFGKQVFYKHIVQCSLICKFCGCRFHNTDSFIAHDAGCRSYTFQVYAKSKSKSKSMSRNKSKSLSPNDLAKLKDIAGGCLIHCKYCAKPFTLQEMTMFDKHTAVCSVKSKGKQMTKKSSVKMPNAKKKKTAVPKKKVKLNPGTRPTASASEIRNQSDDESDSDDSASEKANAQKLKSLRQTYFTWKEEREARLGKRRLNDNLKTRLVECEEEAVVEYCSLEDDEPPFKDTIMLDFLTETNDNAEQSKLTRIDKHSWHMRPKSKAALFSVNSHDKIVKSSQFQPRCLVSKLSVNATLNDLETGSSTEFIDEPDSGTCDIKISDVRSNVDFYSDGVDAQTGNVSGSEEFCSHLENSESGKCDLSIVKEEYQSAGSENPETSGQLDLSLVKVENEDPFEEKTADSNVIDELEITKKDQLSWSDEIRPLPPNPSFSEIKSNISSALASISAALQTSQQRTKKKKKIFCTRCGHKVKVKHLDKHPCDQFLKRATTCFVLLRDISKEEYVKISSPMRARLVKSQPTKIVISSKPLFADIQTDDVEASEQISKLESESPSPSNRKKMKTETTSETAEDSHVKVSNDAKIKSAAAGRSKVVVTKYERVNEKNDVLAQRPLSNAVCLKRGIKREISYGGSDEEEMMDASGVYVGKVPIRRSPRTKMPEWRHSCNVCGEKFFNDTLYRTHLRLHSDLYPFVCSMCGSCFQKEHCLNFHIRARKKNGLLSCDKCSIKFCSINLLQQHAKLHSLKQS